MQRKTWLGPDGTNCELLVRRLKREDEVTPCSLIREDGHALSRGWCPLALLSQTPHPNVDGSSMVAFPPTILLLLARI